MYVRGAAGNCRPYRDLSIHRELRRKGVTLQLLWEEYLAAHAGQPTYRYTQFVEHYRRYAQTLTDLTDASI
ncbi:MULTISPECIES: hypothetical protein [Pseudomonas]|nr:MULTISPECIES: hypothetical protein [unclassified Pseudomonas]OPK05673.1 hypothetical protein BZ164_03120 [Pseudomonas veronii]UHH01079.1 hypothetical protein LQ249_30805 [Pseudomonas sp. 7-41]WLD70337.1 hypothetical protein QU606_12645 [Pseudomonas sp. OVF7]